MTHNVTSPPLIAAVRKAYSITSSAIESSPERSNPHGQKSAFHKLGGTFG